MRQVTVQVPRGRAGDILRLAEKYRSINTTMVEATNGEEALDLVTLHVDNKEVEGLLADVDTLEDIPTRLVFQPQGVLAFYPPPEEAPQQVADVTTRSPIEVFLSRWMSIGSWPGYRTTENPDEDTLLARVYVRQDQTAEGMPEELGAELRRLIQARVRQSHPQIVPLVDVIVLAPPGAPAP